MWKNNVVATNGASTLCKLEKVMNFCVKTVIFTIFIHLAIFFFHIQHLILLKLAMKYVKTTFKDNLRVFLS